MPRKSVIRIALATALLLLVPLAASQITEEMAWDPGDFVLAGALVAGLGVLYELAAQRAGTNTYRAAAALALLAMFFLIWVNLAVGVIGSEGNPANLMFAGVLGIGAVGALIARFQPTGMAQALFATALAQALVPVIAKLVGNPALASGEAFLRVAGLNAGFVLLFAGSALLFRRAARQEGQGV